MWHGAQDSAENSNPIYLVFSKYSAVTSCIWLVVSRSCSVDPFLVINLLPIIYLSLVLSMSTGGSKNKSSVSGMESSIVHGRSCGWMKVSDFVSSVILC